MKRVINLASCSRHLSLSLVLVLFTVPLWADIGSKTSSNASADKVGPVKNDKSLPDGDKSKKGDKKGGSSVKKSAAKKAGTAVAAGVATKKVTSEIKK